MPDQKRILVAPLNWGLGHATRCIPIIEALKKNGFEPIIASDGVALSLLQKEFPSLKSLELPSYKIEYAQKGKNFKLKMIWDSPKVLKAMAKEKKEIKRIVKKYSIDGIISDNRLGVYSKKVPCVFITHQLNVLSETPHGSVQKCIRASSKNSMPVGFRTRQESPTLPVDWDI